MGGGERARLLSWFRHVCVLSCDLMAFLHAQCSRHCCSLRVNSHDASADEGAAEKGTERDR